MACRHSGRHVYVALNVCLIMPPLHVHLGGVALVGDYHY